RKRVLLASTDVRRPAAMLQLERLASQVHAEYFAAAGDAAPAAIAQAALARARSGVFDALIVDTAGRLHVDESLMAEVREIDAAVGVAERLFVVDAMAGQDAVNAARAFGAALELTGVILTKADGDARGGAALSVRQVTGKPDRKSTRLNSSHVATSYAVFCLKKKNNKAGGRPWTRDSIPRHSRPAARKRATPQRDRFSEQQDSRHLTATCV